MPGGHGWVGWGFGLRSLSIADEIQPLKSAVLLFCFDCGVLVRKKVHITSVRPYLPPYSYRPHTRQTGRFVSSQRPLALKPPSPCKHRGSSRAGTSSIWEKLTGTSQARYSVPEPRVCGRLRLGRLGEGSQVTSCYKGSTYLPVLSTTVTGFSLQLFRPIRAVHSMPDSSPCSRMPAAAGFRRPPTLVPEQTSAALQLPELRSTQPTTFGDHRSSKPRPRQRPLAELHRRSSTERQRRAARGEGSASRVAGSASSLPGSCAATRSERAWARAR